MLAGTDAELGADRGLQATVPLLMAGLDLCWYAEGGFGAPGAGAQIGGRAGRRWILALFRAGLTRSWAGTRARIPLGNGAATQLRNACPERPSPLAGLAVRTVVSALVVFCLASLQLHSRP